MTTRIAVITDLHWPERVKRISGVRCGDMALDVIDEFFNSAAEHDVKTAIQLGDAITVDRDGKNARKFPEIHTRLNEFPYSIHHIPGNNEDKYYDRLSWSEACGSPETSSSEDIGGIHMILFRPRARIKKMTLPEITEDINWLDNDLSNTDLPTVIFSHVPLFKPAGGITYDVDINLPDSVFFYPEHDAVQEVINSHPNVTGLVCGHLHREVLEVSEHGYFCLCLESATQSSNLDTDPIGAYGILDFDTKDQVVKISLTGKHDRTEALPLRYLDFALG